MTKVPTKVPSGSRYLEVAKRQQDACSAESHRALTQLPAHVRATHEHLGTVLAWADGFASCFWGCHGKEHVFEFLVGRSVSMTRAALRLIEFGHYDEALALVRCVAEIGNLMQLFHTDPSEIRAWLDSTPRERKSGRYTPGQIRSRLRRSGSVVPHADSDYGFLCRTAVHPNPDTRPQAFNEHGIPTVGGRYQESAFIKCLNEVGWALATVLGPAAKLAILDRAVAEEIVEATIALGRAIDVAPGGAETSGSSERLLDEAMRAKAHRRRQRKER